MLLILKVDTTRNVTTRDYAKIRRGIEKLGYAVHFRPDILNPHEIIIEGADTWPEIAEKLAQATA